MKVYFASDHAGFELKEKIIEYVYNLGYEVYDYGNLKFDILDDYPDYISLAAEKISQEVTENNFQNRAIIFGGSGQGEAIVANRYKGVRAVVYYGGLFDIIKLGREHNDANILSIGARFVEIDEAKRVVKEFLELDFSHDLRHERRIKKIEKLKI